MVKFVCDNKDIEKALRRLHKQVVANGGLVYDGLTIGCHKGSFKITCDDKAAAGDRILVLPKNCLLPLDKFTLGLKGNNIVIKAHDKSLSKGQVAMMETMMELYNLTHKVRDQKKIATFSLYYEDRELFDLILKSHNRQGIPFLEKMITTDRKLFYLESFLKTRVLGFKEVQKNPAEKGSKKKAVPVPVKGEPAKGEKRVQVLMPIIDFLNHHPTATGFFTSFKTEKGPLDSDDAAYEGGGDGVAVVKCCPFEGSDEVYVNYGPYDAADTLIHYNYVEKNTAFVRSVPMQIKIPGVCTLLIKAVSGRANFKKLPDKIKDLKFFVPSIKADRARGTAELSALFIPQENAPRALRRVLALAINQAVTLKNDQQLMEAVRYAEKRVIAENLRYYSELSVYLNLYEPTPATRLIAENAKEMARTQLEKIRNYPFFDEAQAAPPKRKKTKTRAKVRARA